MMLDSSTKVSAHGMPNHMHHILFVVMRFKGLYLINPQLCFAALGLD